MQQPAAAVEHLNRIRRMNTVEPRPHDIATKFSTKFSTGIRMGIRILVYPDTISDTAHGHATAVLNLVHMLM